MDVRTKGKSCSLAGDLVCFTFGAFGGVYPAVQSDQSRDFVCVLCAPKTCRGRQSKQLLLISDSLVCTWLADSFPVRLLNSLRETIC